MVQDSSTNYGENDSDGDASRPLKRAAIPESAASPSPTTLLQHDVPRKQEPIRAAGNDAPVSAHMLKALAAIRACKTRAILTDEQAGRIYQIKLDSQAASILLPSSSERALVFRAGAVARAFGVSDKAIRDIWKGRTWLRETMHLDPTRAAMAGALRPPGRPKGRTARPAQALRRATSSVTSSSTELGGEEGRTACCAFDQVVVKDEGYCGPVRSPRPDHAATPSAAESLAGAGRAALAPCSHPPSCGSHPKISAPSPPPPDASSQVLSEARLRAASTVVAAAATTTTTAATAVATALAASFSAALLHGAAAGLPASSGGDDPFHDDWTHW